MGPEDTFEIDVEGFEGPLDLLLTLARSQKVDLRAISVSALADQFLGFVETARRRRIELAADYLVMAAWLALLKSRLLLPPDPDEEGPSAQEMADALAWRLARLEAMREAAERLTDLPRLGDARFARGAPEAWTHAIETRHTAALIDLMRAYASLRTRDEFRPYVFDRTDLFTMEEALERLRLLVGRTPDWANLARFLPDGWTVGPRGRSARASVFAASLEMVKEGSAEIRQSRPFAPVELRRT